MTDKGLAGDSLDLTSITPEVVFAQTTAMTASAMGVGVEKKVLNLAQVEGADLARMIDSSGGVGQSINTYA